MTQFFLFALLAWAAALPSILRHGLVTASRTYWEAAGRLGAEGLPHGPYSLAGPGADVYKYSPFFAQAFQIFLPLPEVWAAALWGLVNVAVFFWGVGRAFRLSRDTPWWAWVGLLLASMELNGSLQYQQVNGLLAGLCLAGLADFRDARYRTSALWWALAANIKIFPLALAGALVLGSPRKFGVPFVVASLAFVLFPALQVGLVADFHLHQDWLLVLARDLSRADLLDARTLMIKAGLPAAGEALRWLIAGVTTSLFLWAAFPARPHARFPWAAWACCGWSAILLLNSGTESPTFVLLAPVYLFGATEAGRTRCWIGAVAAALITVQYSDLWPRAVRLHGWETFAYKSAGTLVLWIIASLWLMQELSNGRFRRQIT